MTIGGVIDPSYSGDLGVILYNISETTVKFEKGSSIAQMIVERCVISDITVCREPIPIHEYKNFATVLLKEVDGNNRPQRTDNGFGSSDQYNQITYGNLANVSKLDPFNIEY